MRKLYINHLCLILSFLFAVPLAVQSQIVAWNLTTAAGNEVSITPNTLDTHLDGAASLTRGSGITAAALGGGFSGTGWNVATEALAISGNKYYQFTIKSLSANNVSLSTLDATVRRSGTGPNAFQWQYSLDGFATAGVDIGANISYTLTTSAGDAQPQLNLSGIAGLQSVGSGTTITIRLYGWGASGSGGTFAFGKPASGNSLSIGGTTSTVVVTGPAVSGSPGNLAGFGAVVSAPSNPAQTETVSGVNLTDNITVTATAGYEVSTDNITFQSSVTLPQSSGTVTATPVNVRISSTPTIGPVSGTLSIASAGATTQTFTLTGAVTSNINPPQSFAASALSSSEIDLSGTGNAAGDNILVAFNGSATFGTPIGALAIGAAIGGGGTVLYNGPSAGFSFAHTGLTPSTKYFYSAWSVDGSNNYSTAALTAYASTNNPPAANIVVNQVYGGGGNSDAVYTNDFIELYNDADTAVPLRGWSVQYASATGSSWQVTPLGGTIPSHGFYLVQEAKGTGGTTALPAPDTTGSIAMAAGSGKVILCNTTIAQSGNIPIGVNVIDKVGYGASDKEEGPGTAPLLTNTTADVRKTDGVDNNDNALDFMTISPLPRNSVYIITPPVVATFNPPSGFATLSSHFIPSLAFSKPVVKGSGSVTLVTNGVPGTPIDINDAGIVISGSIVTFNIPLSGGNTYAIEITAGAIRDIYGNPYAGLLTATAWTFTTYNSSVATTLPVNYDFNTCSGSGLLPNGFTQFSVTGAQVWDCTVFGRDPGAPQGAAPFGNAVEVNGFANSINNTNKDWLISPKLDLTATAFPLLSYWSRNAFAGDPLQLKISTDYSGTGDPNLATWTDLNGKLPSVGSDTWTQSSNINLSNFKQTGVYIAFVYTSTTDDGSRWSLDDISLINSLTPPPPSLTLSTGNIEFGFASVATTVTKRLTITGNDLVGDVTVSSEGSFLLSTDSVSFTTSVTLGHDTANNIPEPVFVRFSPAIANSQFIDSLHVVISDTTATVNVKGNSIDPASTLSIVDWNLNWFGTPDPTLGVDDKSLQETNVAIILPSLHADLYVLQEVVNTHALDSIVGTMPGYSYVINDYGSHSNITESDPEPLDQVQKLAFVYNTAKIANIVPEPLLSIGINTAPDVATTYYNDWASGRYPYMLTADVTLADPNGGTNMNRIHFINIHGKSNLSPVITSYNRRKDGAHALDSLIQAKYPTDNVMILGDFNDDLNQTITAGINPPITSYSSFTIDHASLYKFPTQLLSQQGQHSDINFTSVIDNVVVNNSLANFYLPSSATVLSDVAGLVPKYGSTTTDHYPVFTQFSFTPPVALPVTLLNFTGVRQDETVKLSWTTAQESNSREFDVERSGDGSHFTSIGVVAAKGNSVVATDYTFTDAQPLTGSNYYRLRQVDLDGKAVYSKTVKLDFGTSLALRILPNPAHGTANIFVGNTTEALSIQILDLNGRVVKQIITTPGTANIPVDLTGVARGVYMVKVISSASLATEKLLVQ